MKHFNELTLIGTIGKKEVRSDKQVLCRVATDRHSGETDWHNCVFWDKLAEVAKEYLQVGQEIWLRGPCRARSYEEGGSTRWITELIVHDMNILTPTNKTSERDPIGPKVAPAPLEIK